MDQDAGELLNGRYRPGRRLGRGGMGVVWAARDELLQRDVALKQVRLPTTLDDDEREVLLQRTRREAQSAARISSPAVMTVFDVLESRGDTWIVLELLTARTLEQELADRGRLPPAEAAAIGLGLLAALRAAHAAGVLHRDLKPANVFLDAGPGRPVVLGDFGIARIEGDAALTSTGMIIGSPQYVAPERARGATSLPASDMWSLGATLFCAVEGRPPFSGDGPLATLSAVVTDDVPPAEHAGPLAPVIEGLLRKDPQQRLTLEQVAPLLERAAGPAAGAGEGERSAGAAGAAGAVGAGAGAVAGAAAADGGTVQASTGEDGWGEPQGNAAATAPHPTAGPEPEPTAAPEPEPEPVPAAAPDPAPPAASAPAGSPATAPGSRSAPEQYASPAPEASGPSRSHQRPVLVAVAATVAALAALGTWAVWPDGDSTAGAPNPATSETAQSGSDPEASVEPAPGGSDPAAEPSGEPSTPAEPSAPAEDPEAAGEGAVPEGFERYADPTGFSVAVPQGWQAVQDGPRVRLEDPDGSRYLMVDQTDDPKGDPYEDWLAQEPTVAGRLDGYQLVGIERVDSPHGEAADWEFRHGTDSRVHVLNRNLLVSDELAYALYWSAPHDSWAEQQELFATIADTFQPAGG